MTFKQSDWEIRVGGLAAAEQLLEEYAQDKKTALLDQALWHIWRFAEYALNAGLELLNERTDRGHNLRQTAGLLYSKKFFRTDHSKLLEQLENYRQKVEYGSFSRKKSVHFNRANVAECLQAIQEIRGELETHLRQRGKLP